METIKNILAGYSGLQQSRRHSMTWLLRTSIAILVVFISLLTVHARAEAPILLLDFTGYQGSFNGRIVDVPAFDIDGDTSRFSNIEMSQIYEIHERVREDFSPFHIEVNYHPWLDVDPSKYDARIVIGGTRADSAIRSYGEADVRQSLGIVPVSFPCAGDNLPKFCLPLLNELSEKFRLACTSSLPPANGCPELKLDVWEIAHSTSHEAGHIVVIWNPLDRWLAHYTEQPWETDPINEWDRAALMGSHVNRRDTWWHHDEFVRGYNIENPSELIIGPQDDIGEIMAVLGLTTDNGGNTLGSAPVIPLGPSYRNMWVNGIISMNADSWPVDMAPFDCPKWVMGVYKPCPLYLMGYDTDFWRFYVRSGEEVEVRVYTANTMSDRTRANLVPGFELWRKNGGSWSLVPGASVNANSDVWWIGIEEYLPAGEYAVGVKSAGGYGDLGRYTLRVFGDHIARTP